MILYFICLPKYFLKEFFTTMVIDDDSNINNQDHEKLINELDELMKENGNLETVVQEYKDIDIPIYQGIRFRYLVKINIIFLIMKKCLV